MAIRSIEETEIELGELFPKFREALDVANQIYWKTNESIADRFTLRSRASDISDLAGHELRRLLDGTPGVNFSSLHQTTTLHVKRFSIRVHKFHEENSIALNYNQTSFDLNANDLANGLLGFSPESTVLFLGYKEILAERFHPEILLTCPNDREPYWVKLLGRGTGLPPAIELPQPPDQVPETRVVPRKDRSKKFTA